MITTMEQARDVQAVRVANGKRGWSRAVRRFIKRNHKLPGTNAVDFHAAQAIKSDLPHLPVAPELEPEEPNGNIDPTPKKKRSKKAIPQPEATAHVPQ